VLRTPELPCVIAVVADFQTVGEQRRHTAEALLIDAVVERVGALPVMVPALGARLDIAALLARVDGLLLPGGLTNVHPRCYGDTTATPEGLLDPARDDTALPLLREAVRRGVPTLCICRGLQELNVAFGGSLKRERDDFSEKAKHGTPASARSDDARYRLRHGLNVVAGGLLHAILGKKRTLVNSLHSQLVDRLAPGLCVEATADDGSIEAVSVRGALDSCSGSCFILNTGRTTRPLARFCKRSGRRCAPMRNGPAACAVPALQRERKSRRHLV
jgi:putative glutamine amidotransferase